MAKTEKTLKGSTPSTREVRPQGTPLPPAGNRLPNGKPNLAPSAGYDGHAPVQFEDESDEMFAGRVAMFESALANAVAIEKGGLDIDGQIRAAEARHEAEIASLEAMRDKAKK